MVDLFLLGIGRRKRTSEKTSPPGSCPFVLPFFDAMRVNVLSSTSLFRNEVEWLIFFDWAFAAENAPQKKIRPPVPTPLFCPSSKQSELFYSLPSFDATKRLNG